LPTHHFTMSDPQPSTPAAPSAGSVGKKNTNKNRMKARSQFDASAPSIPLEKFFSDFQEIKRNNVSVELDYTLLDRLAAPYLDKASDYADLRMLEETTAKDNLIKSTYGLVGMTLVRKLIKSAPASVQPNLSLFKFIADSELYVPPSLATVVDNLGKVSSDQFTVRLEYVEQDILRNVLRTLKGLSAHSQFKDKYITFSGGPTWAELDVEKVLLPSVSSSRWLRDVGKEMLADTAYRTFDAKVTIGGSEVTIKATFPQLKLTSSRQVQLDNIVSWAELINPDLPFSGLLGAAALFQIWQPHYFARLTSKFSLVEPALEDTWLGDLTPLKVLKSAGFLVADIKRRSLTSNWIEFLSDAHAFISGHGRVIFDKFLKLTKQPDTQFGTFAQLLELDDKAWSSRSARSVPDFKYFDQRSDMSATCLFKFNEKALITTSLLFGFSKRVWYTNSQSARLNGNISSTRLAYLSSDFVNL